MIDQLFFNLFFIRDQYLSFEDAIIALEGNGFFVTVPRPNVGLIQHQSLQISGTISTWVETNRISTIQIKTNKEIYNIWKEIAKRSANEIGYIWIMGQIRNDFKNVTVMFENGLFSKYSIFFTHIKKQFP